MRIFFFVILFISLYFQVYAQQKQLKKSLVGRSTLVEVIEAKKTKLYSLIPSYGRIISLEPYSIISKVNEEVKKKKDLEKIILFDVPTKIYPELETSFLNLIHNSGHPEIKLEKKIDFDKLYNERFN